MNSMEPTPASVAPTSAAPASVAPTSATPASASTASTASPGPNAAPFSWERDVHPLWTREMMALLAPAGLLTLAVLVGGTVVLALAKPELAGTMVPALVIVLVLIPLILWAALAFGNLQYGRPRPIAYQVGPFGVRQVRSREASPLPGVVLAALDAMDALDGRLPPAPPEAISAIDVPWSDVTGATFDDARHVAAIRFSVAPVSTSGKPGAGRLALYCDERDWDRVAAWVRWGIASRRTG